MRVASEASDGGDHISIEIGERSGDDLLVIVDVQTRGFTARIDTWVLGGAWRAFCEQLAVLASRRHGEATVESVSPRELRLTVRATDRAGHMAIEGLVGYRGARGDVLLSFSPMAFDPSILPDLVLAARQIAG